jgi:hypothetical protein
LVFIDPETLEALTGKELILATMQVGNPLPESATRQFLRAAE